jgi:hypothetical protein
VASRIGTVVAREIRKALPATLFFFFLFHMIGLTRAVSLEEYSFTALRSVGATIAALIVAKSILIAEALPIPRLFSGRRIFQVVWKTLLYSAVALLFKVLEEILSLASRHGGLAGAAKAMYLEVSWPLAMVLTLWIVGGLFLYCLVSEVADAVGPKRIRELLFRTRSSEREG